MPDIQAVYPKAHPGGKNRLSQRLVLTADSTEGALQRSPWQLVVASSGGLESLNTKKGAHKVSQSARDI